MLSNLNDHRKTCTDITHGRSNEYKVDGRDARAFVSDFKIFDIKAHAMLGQCHLIMDDAKMQRHRKFLFSVKVKCTFCRNAGLGSGLKHGGHLA